MGFTMGDRFDYRAYWQLLDHLMSSHQAVCFADVNDRFPSQPFFILRHDVDYSLEAALALAEQEARRKVRATYFLLPNGPYYNLLAPEHARVPASLAALGHEIGLHYDVGLLRQFPADQRMDLVRMQVSLLERLSGSRVQAISMHQPGLNGDDPLKHRTEYANAYDDRFFKEMTYISDSCQAWRDHAWQTLTTGPLPRQFQLALHPINWSAEHRDRRLVFSSIHDDLTRSISAAGSRLMEQISRHPAVVEHVARHARLLQETNR